MEAYAFRELELKQASRRRRARGPVAALTLTAAAAKPIAKKGSEIEKPVAPVVPDLGAVLKKASATAFRGGMAGFAAGVVQVGSFMWMRTVMNFQYANGGTMANAMVTLWKEGGVPRFYKGVSFAIIQNPMSRFGDTAANTGVLAVMDVYFPEAPMALKTALASVGGATWRILLTPVDTFKTTLQVQGNTAFNLLRAKVAAGGIGQLYGGASANFVANWVGNYPWFVTFNFLQAKVPKYTDTKKKLLRNAAIGIAASAVSDTVSNSLRVIKTVKQTNADASLGYVGVIKSILAKDGMKGLFGRGLSTRLITNMAQSMVFSVGWKAIEEELNARAARADAKKVADEAAAAAAAKGGKKGGKSGSITAVRGLAGSKLVSA